MTGDLLIPCHIGVSVVMAFCGFAAILLRKGSQSHRIAGWLFLATVVCLAATGGWIILLKPESIIVGWMATPMIYLALTGWLAARRRTHGAGASEIVGALMALAIGISGVPLGLAAQQITASSGKGFSSAAVFGFVGIAFGLAALDASVILRGGLTGAQRIARHLWRMGTVLALTSALSLGTLGAVLLPKSLQGYTLLPSALAFALMLFWLARMLVFRGRRKHPGEPASADQGRRSDAPPTLQPISN